MKSMKAQARVALAVNYLRAEMVCASASREQRRRSSGGFGSKLSSTIFLCFALAVFASFAQNAVVSTTQPSSAVIEFVQNQVEVLRFGSKTWDVASTDTNHNTLHPGDQLRTGENSRAGLHLPGHRAILILDANSYLTIPREPQEQSAFELLMGRLFNFHRGTADEQRFKTPTVSAIVRGTDFSLKVNPDGETTVSMIDGQVHLENSFGQMDLQSEEEAVIEKGEAPRRAPGIMTVDVVQWCFFYPGVLDPDDLPLNADERSALKASLDAYRSGDLLTALARYPDSGQMASGSERVYHAALLLSVGQVEQTESELASLPAAGQTDRLQRLADSLRTLIAAVKRQQRPSSQEPRLPTELLAASYYEQSRATGDESLRAALSLARRATVLSPHFGFAWARVAELEFGFGRVDQASAALDKSLLLSPKNGQALALKGFLLAAQNDVCGAATWFDRAIAIDGSLANAWLGRGLCSIRIGDDATGRRDLLTAAALEPQRSVLRSYLAKAFADAGQDRLANREIALALRLDPGDPTAWLYSALLKQQENRINAAIVDMEKSQSLNDNRQLFRSKMLLDEDNAVRSVNLATMYDDAGMDEVGVREAAKAVAYDYDNASAHLFLSDSYNALRDPTMVNLRYETVWFNELLLANLLAPVGAGRLSLNVTDQEYSKLFEQNGFGVANSTTVTSEKTFSQQTSQFGTFGKTSYSLDLNYLHNDGVRINNDLDSIDWYSTIKQQITPNDTAMVIVEYYNYHSGDNFQYYYQSNSMPHYRLDEYQSPTVVGGWHHEWAPGVDTLLLGGRLVDNQHIGNAAAPQLLLIQNQSGNVFLHDLEPFGVDYHNELQIYTIELNQIFQWTRATLVAGGRYQAGPVDTQMTFTNPPALVTNSNPLFPTRTQSSSETGDLSRATAYGYLTVEPLDRVWLTGGLAYDDISFPLNYRNPPLTPGQAHRSQLGPKAAAVWEITPQVTFRGIFARSQGGMSLDESFRLEPTQLAGFPQTFRSLIPESVVGSVSAPEFEVYGGALDLKFPTKTYLGVQVEELNSKVERTDGTFLLEDQMRPYIPASTPENLDYRELTASATVNQLLGPEFALGTSYSYDRVHLGDVLPDVPVAALSTANQQDYATLQEASAYFLFNHPSGFFAEADATWYLQHNSGYSPALPGDNFAQENIYFGKRFWNRRCQLEFGILNLGNQDYNLNPLNTYAELPRCRTYMAQLKFIF